MEDTVLVELKKIGHERFNEVCNIAYLAITQSGYRENQRLTFAYDCNGLHGLEDKELSAIFQFRLLIFKNSEKENG